MLEWFGHVFDNAIRRRHLIDWFVITASATGITVGLYSDELFRRKPHDLLILALPICWVAFFLVTWIVVAVFDS